MSVKEARKVLERCIEDVRTGRLTEQRLGEVAHMLDEFISKGQDLLYLQAQSTSVDSPLVGMSLVEHGEVRDEPAEPDQWPYQSVLDAIRDGWRIVKFPEMAVLLNEERTYGLGHEFILER